MALQDPRQERLARTGEYALLLECPAEFGGYAISNPTLHRGAVTSPGVVVACSG